MALLVFLFLANVLFMHLPWLPNGGVYEWMNVKKSWASNSRSPK